MSLFTMVVLTCACASTTPEPVAPEPEQAPQEARDKTPCEAQPDVPCDNYDRAGILAADAARATVEGVKDASSWVLETAEKKYQEYKDKDKK